LNTNVENQKKNKPQPKSFGILSYVLNNITKHRWRSTFTIIGIAVPIAFFILFAGIGDGLDSYIISESQNNPDAEKDFTEISKIVKSWSAVLAGVIAIMIIINITNTMLISTSARKFEFGILRALGISSEQIINLVILEAFIISSLALILGLIIGIWSAILFDYMFWFQGGAGSFFAPANVNIESIIIASILTLFIGSFTAMFPAIRAGRLNPIKILRCE
jgi:ABC-type antimicrobial peptide transport system permease subunit